MRHRRAFRPCVTVVVRWWGDWARLMCGVWGALFVGEAEMKGGSFWAANERESKRERDCVPKLVSRTCGQFIYYQRLR